VIIHTTRRVHNNDEISFTATTPGGRRRSRGEYNKQDSGHDNKERRKVVIVIKIE
jgi:hypothetical protein